MKRTIWLTQTRNKDINKHNSQNQVFQASRVRVFPTGHTQVARLVTGQEDNGHQPNQKWPNLHALAATINQPHIYNKAFHLDRK
jgi:hypothetical protein